ncbi:unnamed protein product [Dovyalis caffra]|uniref:Uncharacterized protein n=1 Tax=Dovyalis caffra TaxID=77055 RepID=A0AAV1RIG8_9ROSI|nr:unnamed protein product [Dovyalis caffra]
MVEVLRNRRSSWRGVGLWRRRIEVRGSSALSTCACKRLVSWPVGVLGWSDVVLWGLCLGKRLRARLRWLDEREHRVKEAG